MGTIRGIEALNAGRSNPASPPARAGSRKSGHSAGVSSRALSARPALTAASNNSVTRSNRRRSWASATAPPINDQTISGTSWAKLTSPTSRDEWVMLNTW